MLLRIDQDPPVTVVITRKVKPGCKKAFEKFISGITATAMTFEGHLGTNVFRPSNPKDNTYLFNLSNILWFAKYECNLYVLYHNSK